MFLVLGGSAAFFAVGIVQNFGYMGTTPLRTMSKSDWTTFSKVIAKDATAAKKGAPYYFADKKPDTSGTTVKFDSRLAGILDYLASDKSSKDSTCGTKMQHEVLGLSDEAGPLSDLSYPSPNARSGSTVYRGTGIRITSADRIKCTQTCPGSPPKSTAFHAPGYEIPLSVDGQRNFPPEPVLPVPPGCQVICAVDYYPTALGVPIDAPPEELVQPQALAQISSLDPSASGVWFPYDFPALTLFKVAARKAAIYKTSELAYELMNVDNKGCKSASGNTGNQRMIPYTVIFPGWVYSDPEEFGPKGMPKIFDDLAKTKFPYNLQIESPLAGKSSDPLLTIGLHFNY